MSVPSISEPPSAAVALAAPRLPGALARLTSFVLGGAPVRTVPGRVRAAIATSDAETEVLVGWVQVAAIATFAVLYTLTPKAFPPDVPFAPVPWALAAYAGFTALRLWLAYARRLTGWFLLVSILVDFSLLYLTIWSFHLQYGAPPSLYLKAPTLMYAFILIALRALRFEARWVLLAGASACLGWLILLAYAVSMPGAHGITRDFRDYVMSYDILIGAEFDKIVSLAMVSVILAVVVLRARRLLVTATVESVAGAELSRFFAPEVARTIKHADMAIAPGSGVIREAAVLFVDLRGFTRLSAAMAPDEVMQLLGDYQARVLPAIQRQGGSIDKFLGDGILASFGAATPSATAAADGLRAVDDLLGVADRWAAERSARGLVPLHLGFGIAAGPVMFGAVGAADRLEYTVIGDPVNLAAKLEAQTKVEEVRALTDAATLARAVAQGYMTPFAKELRPGRRVVGVAEPVDLAVLG
jgi:adenylate cyclase